MFSLTPAVNFSPVSTNLIICKLMVSTIGFSLATITSYVSGILTIRVVGCRP